VEHNGTAYIANAITVAGEEPGVSAKWDVWVEGQVGPTGPTGPAGPTGPTGPAGVGDFLDLTDTPAAYTSSAGAGVFVNDTPDGLEFGLAVRVVRHGAVAATSRPGAAIVYWLGSVAPDNRATGDLWLETGAFD